MTEQFDPWIRASNLAALLRSHRCVDIERRLRQGAALGDIQAKARIAKLRRIVSAEWEGTRYRDDEERDWLVPPAIWKGQYRARLSLSTDEYYSGLLGRSDGFSEAALIGLSFDRQQALDFFGVEQRATIIDVVPDAVVVPAALQIEASTAVSSAKVNREIWEPEARRVAAMLDDEGCAVRDVRKHHVAERWDYAVCSPVAADIVRGFMDGKPRDGRPRKVSG